MGNRIAKFSAFFLFTMMLTGITITVDRHAEDMMNSISISVQEAQAGKRSDYRKVARRTARRTARRVNRRHSYYYGLPRGCVTVWFGGVSHFRCGGIYYLPQMEQQKTVYIIVTP
jgi:uncharacterized iron-regulated membrane protein